MPEDRTPEEERLLALHEAGHAVAGAAVGSTPERVTVEPGDGDERGYEGIAVAGVPAMDVEALLIVRTAGAAAESLWGPEPRRRLTTFLRTDAGRECWPEMRREIARLTEPEEVFEGETFPPVASDRDEAVDLVRAAFRHSRGMLEECEDLVIGLADRLLEERTLGEKEVRELLPGDLWQEPGSRVRGEFREEVERLTSGPA